MFSKAQVINTLGNRAARSHRRVPVTDALTALREPHHVAYWFARTYARKERPLAGLGYDTTALPPPPDTRQQTSGQLCALEQELRDEKLATLLKDRDRDAFDDELKCLRAEVAEAKQAAAVHPDTHDYSEVETRDYCIDLLLKEAGWPQFRKRGTGGVGLPMRRCS